MAKKFYAVKKGHKKGIFESWDECKKNINGYSGAIYKSFKTLITLIRKSIHMVWL